MAETEGSGFKSRTNSSKGVYKRNGETMAICHKTIPKSYGGPTNSKANTSTMGESFKDPNMKQALTPYHPLAIRNRLPVVFDNAPIPRARFCFPRNNHTYDFFKAGNTPAGFQTYRTTNGNFYGNDTRVLDVGDNNAGIVSYMSKVLHAKQAL
ncbi:hypothetical protein Ctob_010753 [Chrysochromulina tobinii]|uniref:Uncharacterized protein n=1 Tax=Chrysochromulina tobinii TaxID=1460289 RepID=A0A0M0K5R5_9EUKA|nr:hypothetical protein Ctob_010753 [Chrysochromulina tobinii]|eukprot:KOO33937.1 hypothetical protein Ctob_010753 [Chrysochromulina sp. CCMP291]